MANKFRDKKMVKKTDLRTDVKKGTFLQHHRDFYFTELKYYEGSLDFPCDFCGSNSYKNFHLTRKSNRGETKAPDFVVCEQCLNEVKRCK